MRITSLLMMLLLGWLCLASWAETTPNSSVNDVETPPDGQDTTGDPVGVIDGSVLDAAVDIRVECPGIDLVFKRAYGSWSTREGDLGYGWSHSFEWRHLRLGNGKIPRNWRPPRYPTAILFPEDDESDNDDEKTEVNDL